MDADSAQREDGNVPFRAPGECLRCGACCSNPGRPPFCPEELTDRPAEIRYLVACFDTRDPERSSYATPCYFFNLSTRKCLIYADRPQACRDFAPGGQVCQELRRAFVPCLNRFDEDMRNRH